ncbi:MAG: PKD domain-containing protein [Chitinophagaceae bacterium]|nr:PKD domain-containing protein [Chitinophagaceae bacterium]
MPLIGGFYYEIPATNQPQFIESDSAIMVAQYFTSQGSNATPTIASCFNGQPGDPEVIYLSGIEQNINTVQWNATPNFAILNHFLNVVIPNSGTAISSFKLDGLAVPPLNWVVHPQNPAYSYLRTAITNPSPAQTAHIIQSDSGFNAIAYGFGSTESYGYNAGTNIKDLYQQIGVRTQYGIEATPSVCTNSPFKFKVSLPYIPDSMYWNFHNAAGMLPNNTNVFVNNTGNVAEDSFTVVNGRTIHWYSIPLFYNFTNLGVYPITITTWVPNGECGSVQDIDFDLTVSIPPVANFTWTPGGCYAEPYQFTETTPQAPKPTYSFWWNFDDPASGANNISFVRNPTHLFSAPGTYNVRFSDITTPGCLSDTITQQVIVPDLPNATISGTIEVCQNAAPPTITFNGSLGTPPYTFYYHINAGGPLSVSTVGVSTSATITAPTGVPGVFTYTLDSVRNLGSTLCSRTIAGQTSVVTVNPLPTATISGTTSVCQNAPSPNVTFTGVIGTAPFTFSYNINGGPTLNVTTTVGNSVTVAVPTNVVGTFTYTLLSVQDGTATACSQPQAGSAVITVNPLPTATVTGTTAVCQNAPQPLVTFTGATGTAPYTFTYNINGGPNLFVTTTVGNSVTVAAPTNVVGTFTYNLLSVQDGSSTACVQAQSGSAVITVNPLPTATISGTVTVCLNAPSPDITFNGASATAPYTFSYTINGGPVLTVTTVSGNSVTVPAPTNVAGTFTYALVSVQDGSSTTCSQAQSGTAVVTVNPLPTATIAGTTAVCQNAPSPDITFTGAVGTAPYTFSYTINGGPVLTVTTTVGNSVTVSAPTNVVGTFTYTLVNVQEGSPNACQQAQGGTAVITVNPLPTATITGTISVCKDDPSPDVTFTGAGGVAPYTFTYNINGGPNLFVTTTVGNSVTVAAPTNVAGTFTYNLLSVSESSTTLCSQAQSGSVVITVHPLPTANFSYAAPSCETRTISFTDLSIANVGTLNSWLWNFDDPGSGANNTSTVQNPTHDFATSGTYNVTLTVTSTMGCTSLVYTQAVVINARPLAGYIVPEVCLSDTYAQFTDTSRVAAPSTIVAWNWNFGDPVSGPLNTSILQNPTHSYTAVGTYNVELIVTTNTGCKDTIVHVLTVNGSFPVSNFSVNNPATLCANDSVAIVNLATVFPGTITKIEIWWDDVNAGPPGPPEVDDFPYPNKVYKHLYPNFQAPLTKVYTIRFRAYSGGICLNDKLGNITVNAAPLVLFNNMPDTCLLAAPFQLTQASETGGVPGTGVFSGPGVSPTGIFSPAVAGIGLHTILYTYTSSAAGCIDTMSNTIRVLDTAHAVFTYSTPVCDGVPVSFTDQSTAPGTVTLANTVWDFGDGSPIENHAPGSTFTHLFPAPGTYVVTMYNVSAYGCNSTVYSTPVSVLPNHTITLTSGPGSDNPTTCINVNITPITYNLGGGATGAIVTGLPAGMSFTVVGTTLTIQGAPTTAVGMPFLFNIVTTGNACATANAGGSITVTSDHTIILTSGAGSNIQRVCLNTLIAPITYDIGGGATTFTITGLPPGITATQVGLTVTLQGSPTTTTGSPFNYTITTAGNNCVKASLSGTITVSPIPVPKFAVDKPSYCIPNAIVSFINTSTIEDGTENGFTYQWDFGEPSSGINNVSTSKNPTHWYSGIGPFNVKLTVTSQYGCSHDTTITISTIHPQPKADFSTSKPHVRIQDPVTFTDLTDYKDGSPSQWNWNLGYGSIRTVPTFTYTYTDTITFNVTLYTVNSLGCNSDTITKPFTVYPYPKVNAGPDRFILEGGSIQIESVTYGNDLQFLWTPSLYLDNDKVAKPRVTRPLTDMTYILTVTARGGCAKSDDVFVKLLKFPVIPNTFTPNNDGINDTWRIDYLETYPDNWVQVFTRAGQKVFESRGYTKPWDGTIKGKPLPVDTYYYIIEPGSGRDPITGYVTIVK